MDDIHDDDLPPRATAIEPDDGDVLTPDDILAQSDELTPDDATVPDDVATASDDETEHFVLSDPRLISAVFYSRAYPNDLAEVRPLPSIQTLRLLKHFLTTLPR